MPAAPRPLTVLQLLPALDAGGVEQSTLEIAAALVAGGHRALVVSAGGRLVERLQASGARHDTLAIGAKSPGVIRHVRTLRAMILRDRPDIVHARSRLPAWLGWLALRGLPVATRPRFMTTVHGLNSPSRYSAIMASGERVVCVSDTVRDYVQAHYPRTDPAVLRVIPRGIEPARFPRRPRVDKAARAAIAQAHPTLGGDGALLLLPGRGTRLKGHGDALRLLLALRREGRDARLWLPGVVQAGREDYVAELWALATELCIEPFVAMTPPTDAIASAYAATDLVLQLSRKPEAFGRTVVEALSVGAPVLGWDHGGAGELLRELYPAGAVPPFDEALLGTRALALLHAAPQPPESIPYTLSAMQQATLATYADLADAPHRA